MKKLSLISLFLALASAPGEGAERPWIEVRSPHFTVVSNAGDHAAQEIAWQFELVREVFQTLWPWAQREEGRPFVVFVARDEATLRALAPQFWTERNRYGVLEAHVSAAEADYAAIRTDYGLVNPAARANPYEAAFEAYADNVLVRHFRGRMPLWFREGLIEIFGNVIVGGKDVQVGRVITGYAYLLKGGAPTGGRMNWEDRRGTGPASRALLPLERLVAVRAEDPEFTGDMERTMYAAQVWSFVHFLMFADEGAHRPRFNRLMDLLRAGKPGDQATAEALGDVSTLNRAYLDYVDARAFQYQKIPASIDVPKTKWPARTLPPAESDALKARFVAAMARPRSEGAADTAAAGPDLIGECNRGDDAACARLVPGLEAECGRDGAMCMPLAFLYRHGRGVPRDLDKARSLYARACDAGQGRACDSMRQLKD